MGAQVGDSDGDVMLSMNVIPLVDILLVLLVLFIITIPAMTHAVKIDLPRADTPPPQNPSTPINIEVQFDGSVWWNGSVVSGNDMKSYVAGAAKQDPQPEVHITVDRRAKYDYAAAVLFAVQRGGLKKIGFVTDARGGM